MIVDEPVAAQGAMAKLTFPNTLEVYDYGELDDRTQYLTMELVPGRELTAFIAEGPMPPIAFYPLILQLLRALGFIHSRHYVHRDIKAENIRIRDDGALKLMAFGLMERLGLPSTGKITGTPSYLPPRSRYRRHHRRQLRSLLGGLPRLLDADRALAVHRQPHRGHPRPHQDTPAVDPG